MVECDGDVEDRGAVNELLVGGPDATDALSQSELGPCQARRRPSPRFQDSHSILHTKL